MKTWLPIAVVFFVLATAALTYKPRAATIISNTATTTGPAAVSTAPTPALSVPHARIEISPKTILQGDPALVRITGLGTSTVRSITFNSKTIPSFTLKDGDAAVIGIDLNQKSGTYPIAVTLSDGEVIRKNLVVGTRVIAEAPLGIPDSLGGNTPAGESNLLTALAKDNARLNALVSTSTALWSGPFAFPVADPVVTDTYGYTRLTVNSTISHKGTDFHAPPGTPVVAMNSGIVVLSEFMTSYGNAIIVDHGAGIMTLYLHLSERRVSVGDRVSKGQNIGLSGQTGYAEGPHLHISVKVDGTSIDPEKFIRLSSGF
jgi:murein DD-endopeptidase MepM/ murein hydrolase activator NlpD